MSGPKKNLNFAHLWSRFIFISLLLLVFELAECFLVRYNQQQLTKSISRSANVKPQIFKKSVLSLSLFSPSPYSTDVCHFIEVPSEEYPTISDAVRLSRVSRECPAIIQIKPGVYHNEVIRIDKWTEIEANDVEVHGVLTVTPRGGKSKIRGLKVVKDPEHENFATVRIEAPNVTFSNCTISGGLLGLHILGSEYVEGEVTDNIIENTVHGICVEGKAKPTVERNIVTNTRIGVRVGRESAPKILHNKISNSTKNGIAVWQNAKPEIFGNEIQSCKGYAIFVTCSAEAYISQRPELYTDCEKHLSYRCG